MATLLIDWRTKKVTVVEEGDPGHQLDKFIQRQRGTASAAVGSPAATTDQ
jgi:hypothetical protein